MFRFCIYNTVLFLLTGTGSRDRINDLKKKDSSQSKKEHLGTGFLILKMSI